MSELPKDIKSVLVVDDDPILCAMAQSYFHARGAEQVRSAVNGRKGLEVLRKAPDGVDFILCDLSMPDIDGVQFLRHMKDCDYKGRLAILSGEHHSVIKTAERLARTLELNIVGALAKPFQFDDLDLLIKNISSSNASCSRATTHLSEKEMLEAVNSNQIIVYYQPKVDIHTGKFVSAEVLTRWPHPEEGILNPFLFLSNTRNTELIDLLTHAMLIETIKNAIRWRRSGHTIPVSVNLAASSLRRLEYADYLSELVGSAGLSTSHFCLEITESDFLETSDVDVGSLDTFAD